MDFIVMLLDLQNMSQYGTTDLEEYTATLTIYISKCIDDMTYFKTITTHANQKLWMTVEVQLLKT